MSYITLKCKNCGSNMSLNTESNSATCNHCGSTFLINEILDEKDMAFASKFTPKNLEKKMMAQGAIKQGETLLYQGEFEKAETAFKRAIDLDDTNFKPYLGVVKAKTRNLNFIPEDDDYIQYAHYAISLADSDDLVLVQSELSKIELLRREKSRQKKIKSEKKKKQEQSLKKQRRRSKITLVFSLLLLTAISLCLLIGSFYFTIGFNGFSSQKSIDVDSYESLQKVFSSKKYLGYEINITDDINCGGRAIYPLGTSSAPFTGTFNGNKHTISNLKINTNISTYSSLGFFGYTKLANINNIAFDNVDLIIKSETSFLSLTACGLVAGTIDSSTMKNIEVKDTCNLTIENTIAHNAISLGGLVGKALNSSHISQISCHSNIVAGFNNTQEPYNLYLGGLIGFVKNSDIQNTCSNSLITASLDNSSYSQPEMFVSGIAGLLDLNSTRLSNIKNNFFSGVINGSSSFAESTFSAIAYTTANPNSALYNFCLFSQTSFTLNSKHLSQTQLSDYLLNGYFTVFCNQNSDYMLKLRTAFYSWKNTTTLTPSLV